MSDWTDIEMVPALERARVTFWAWAEAKPWYWRPLMLLGARACSAAIDSANTQARGNDDG